MKGNKISENQIKVPVVIELNSHVASSETPQISVCIMHWIQHWSTLFTNLALLWGMTNRT